MWRHPARASNACLPRKRVSVRKIFHENGLTIVIAGIFLILLAGHSVAGFFTYNDDLRDHGQPPVPYTHYLTTGTFIESVTENWESEFLEMGSFVIITRCLFQKGSSESKNPDAGPQEIDEEPEDHCNDPHAPWPVRRGGWVLTIYRHSLSLGLLLLFLFSFTIHAAAGCRAYNENQRLHGQSPIAVSEFVASSAFWFQALQNWQSEFLGIGTMIVLSIFLREKGSPQSKPVHAPNWKTGE